MQEDVLRATAEMPTSADEKFSSTEVVGQERTFR